MKFLTLTLTSFFLFSCGSHSNNEALTGDPRDTLSVTKTPIYNTNFNNSCPVDVVINIVETSGSIELPNYNNIAIENFFYTDINIDKETGVVNLDLETSDFDYNSNLCGSNTWTKVSINIFGLRTDTNITGNFIYQEICEDSQGNEVPVMICDGSF